MIRIGIVFFCFTVILSIAFLSLYFLLFKGDTAPEGDLASLDDTTKFKEVSPQTTEYEQKSSKLPDATDLIVQPLYGFEDLFDDFVNEISANSLNDLEFIEKRNEWVAMKNNGVSRWGSDRWMKTKNYYESLDTIALVRECFEKPIFYNEIGIFANARYGVESLRVFHNGFSELFKRDDYYEGILFLYEDLISKINLDATLYEIVVTSGTFDTLGSLFLYSPLKDQIKGREKLFLDANIKVLQKYRWYLDNFDYKSLGTEGSAGFYREPCSVVQHSLLLLSRIDEAKFLSAKKELSKTLWDESQDIEKLKKFIDLALKYIQ